MLMPDTANMRDRCDISIRGLERSEMKLALDWAAAEGWNPGLFDAEPFYNADPQGFLLGECKTEPVALISATRYGTGFGFVGFYIVSPSWRGQGHGWKIWQAAMQRLNGRNIGLDGVLAQQDNYCRSGFKLAWRNIRFQGVGGGCEPVALGAKQHLASLADLPFAALAAYDRDFFPVEREAFLRSWIGQPHTVALGLMRDGCLVGYGVLRVCRNGSKIGPLFADNSVAAEILFAALRERADPEQPVFLDVPECHGAACALAERHALQPMFETARMYTGPIPDIAIERTFGITSFELG